MERAKAEYRRVVRRLHIAGVSMREIAEALGVSHQRVHQILEGGGPRRWRRRRHGDDVRLVCSFCGREQRQVKRLIAGPNVYICDPCIAEAVVICSRGASVEGGVLTLARADSDLLCTFCGKDRGMADAIIAGPSTMSPPPAIYAGLPCPLRAIMSEEPST